MSDLPFLESLIGGRKYRRMFSASDAEEMVWHRDQEERVVTVESGLGWLLQFDNELPRPLVIDCRYVIPQFAWHRIIPVEGATELVLTIDKLD